MSFSVGDPVRVRKDGPRVWRGAVGYVKKALLAQGRYYVRLQQPDGQQTTRYFDEDELEAVS